ncbi:hypothetical protein, partial [Chryseobacterium sp.]|uniref:hypothetical protein n=1 Tax=Chryseobacterium sp. TaxID=1871047 RepID=UPI0035C690CC
MDHHAEPGLLQKLFVGGLFRAWFGNTSGNVLSAPVCANNSSLLFLKILQGFLLLFVPFCAFLLVNRTKVLQNFPISGTCEKD